MRTHRIKDAQELEAATEWLVEENEAAYREREEARKHRRIERRLTWLILAAILMEIGWNHWREFFPELRSMPDYAHPYSVAFSVKNPSAFFDMKDVKWNCRFHWEDDKGEQHSLEGAGGRLGVVAPGDTKFGECEISEQKEAHKFLSAELALQYRTRIFGQSSPMVLSLKWGGMNWVESDTP